MYELSVELLCIYTACMQKETREMKERQKETKERETAAKRVERRQQKGEYSMNRRYKG